MDVSCGCRRTLLEDRDDLRRDLGDLLTCPRVTGVVVVEKRAVHLDCNDGVLGRRERRDCGGQQVRVVAHETRRGNDGSALRAIHRVGELESPLPRAFGDGGLFGVVELDTTRGEDSTVVRAARTRPVVVDRARAVDEHRAVTSLVVSEHHVTGGPARCREPQIGRDTGEGRDLVGGDVHELRRRAARGTGPTGHHRGGFSAHCMPGGVEPLGEGASRQRLVLGLQFVDHGAIRASSWWGRTGLRPRRRCV